jgi:hypothetical protein
MAIIRVKRYTCSLVVLLLVLVASNMQAQDEYPLKVSASIVNSQAKTYGPWKDYATRSMETLNGYQPNTKVPLDKYGGRTDKKFTATGFFSTVKDNGRWWVIDPDGNAFVNIGLVNVSPATSPTEKNAMNQKYGDASNWADETQKLLLNNGFNALGAWSNVELFKNTSTQRKKPVTYTIIKSFMSDYGKHRGGTYQESGHMGYPDRTIFVFDPEFESFCDEYAKQLEVNKDDKNLFGYFSDNELPFERQSLDRYLAKKDQKDPGYIYATKWLAEKNIAVADINDSLRNEFLGVMAEKYFSVVSKAIKKYDPNHMYLGSRLHSYELKVEPVFKAVGKYVDVIAINYYRFWTPVAKDMANWEKWSGKPFIVTEWYVKGEDSKMTNYSGAGWLVKTQNDRGLFYQNFSLALLESKVCVGFHWFKYQDNDPEEKNVDPSNTDANKGIVNTNYDIYEPLLSKMKEVNTNVYSLIDFFDKRAPLRP